MLIVIGYILIGAYMFDELEDFGFGNAAYFCVITLTTIGMCRACTCPKLPGYCPGTSVPIIARVRVLHAYARPMPKLMLQKNPKIMNFAKKY